MHHYLAVALAASAEFLLLTGCERAPSSADSKPPSSPAQASAIAQLKEPDSKTDMILIPAGRFMMGDKEEADAPLHEVAVSAFYLDKYLVTQEQYEQVLAENPSRWKGGKNPVEQVRWSDAVKFCNGRSRLERLQPCYDLKTWKCNFEADGYRLPTEAEWEYACRAGSTTAYFFGDSAAKLGDYAWFDKNSGGVHIPPVRSNPTRGGCTIYAATFGNGATTFTKWIITRRVWHKTQKGRVEAKTRWFAVGRGGSVRSAVAQGIAITKIPGMPMCALATTSMGFGARGSAKGDCFLCGLGLGAKRLWGQLSVWCEISASPSAKTLLTLRGSQGTTTVTSRFGGIL